MPISANRNTTSVIGRCRPVSTFASLTGAASGSVTEDSSIQAIRSRVASPAGTPATSDRPLHQRREVGGLRLGQVRQRRADGAAGAPVTRRPALMMLTA